MNGQQIKDLDDSIAGCEDVAALAKLAAFHQYESWHDPCGKSGSDFNDRHISLVTSKCLRRIGQLTGLE